MTARLYPRRISCVATHFRGRKTPGKRRLPSEGAKAGPGHASREHAGSSWTGGSGIPPLTQSPFLKEVKRPSQPPNPDMAGGGSTQGAKTNSYDKAMWPIIPLKAKTSLPKLLFTSLRVSSEDRRSRWQGALSEAEGLAIT